MNHQQQISSVAQKKNQKDEDFSSFIYHIADPNQWEQAQVSRYYTHPSLHTEGFVHCSKVDQLEDTANHYFSENDQILVLFIDPQKLEPELIYESATRGGEYPHIYGAININSIVRSKVYKRRGKKFKLPFTEERDDKAKT
jgi:uncharacterized protein (DUF952 family)